MTYAETDAPAEVIRRMYRWFDGVRGYLRTKGLKLPVGTAAVHVDIGEPGTMVLGIDGGGGFRAVAETQIDAELEVFVGLTLSRGLAQLPRDAKAYIDEQVATGSAFCTLGLLLGQPAGDVLTCTLVSTVEPDEDIVVFEVGPPTVVYH